MYTYELPYLSCSGTAIPENIAKRARAGFIRPINSSQRQAVMMKQATRAMTYRSSRDMMSHNIEGLGSTSPGGRGFPGESSVSSGLVHVMARGKNGAHGLLFVAPRWESQVKKCRIWLKFFRP